MSLLHHDRYAVGEVLGRGAQAVVARVVDREAETRALVAKIWQPGLFSPALLSGEFALLARVRIAGLVRAHDLGRDRSSGAPFLVEDFVDGVDARAWVQSTGSNRERVDRIGHLLADVGATLAMLHDAGFLHGDLKPAHVRVPSSGRAMLLDLGAAVARASRDSGALAVTAGYAAPELLAGGAPSQRSDLYALGALAFAIATGAPPERRVPLRQLAPWVPPSLGDLVDALTAEHPADRPSDARELLRRLGEGKIGFAAREARFERAASTGSSPREREIALLSRPAEGVRHLTGPAGSGKSHVLAEVVTRALLGGRDARLVRFPSDDSDFVLRLVAWLRGAEAARPFVSTQAGPLLVGLDDLHRAPVEVASALEAFRCRPGAARGFDVIATTRTAPSDTSSLELQPLDEAGVAKLCRELVDEHESVAAGELLRVSGGNPGWIAAALGRVPLTAEAALERVSTLSDGARALLGAAALLGGRLPVALARALLDEAGHRAALAELAARSLVSRAGATAWALSQPALTEDLSRALADRAHVDRLASVLLDGRVALRAEALLSVARAPVLPVRREELLRRAAARARSEGARSEEIEALLALASDPSTRSAEVLTELDRATRGGGSAGLHPELVEWLSQAAARHPALGVLALRRRAEQLARSGDTEEARRTAEQALALAEHEGDPAGRALALSTLGAVALYRADWSAADAALGRASATLAAGAVDDAEELARLHHNRGVVALYRGRCEEACAAFEQSLGAKRALGDRAGTWACLLNLGLGLAKLGRFDEAEVALDEAFAICRALSQGSGAAWCLTARADVAVRRGDAREAERRVSEAEHWGAELPEAVRADLALLRAQIALLDGDGQRALAEVGAISSELREQDAYLGARAEVVEARALLATLPADRRAAARHAIRALRRARRATLPEPEAQALAVLREARRRPAPPAPAPAPTTERDGAMWALLADLAELRDRDAGVLAVARFILDETRAERAFVIALDPDGTISSAWGSDIDGLAFPDAAERVDRAALRDALQNGGMRHEPTVETRAGRGSRLIALAKPPAQGARAAIIAEHRFVERRFDAVSRERAEQWATLASLSLAIAARAGEAVPALGSAPAPSERPEEPSTVLPARQRRRAFASIVGQSPALERALARLDAAADSDLPALIMGETGVGKELFARALHESGARAKAPFVAVNCGALADSLFESELFGHARGSFTGAERARPGLIARAEGGTLFLDEIGELPLARQATLLRSLATRSYRPVGSDEEKPFDVRIIAATNRELEREVEAGRFRRDLLYRLNVLEVRVPALRDRAGDVLILARHVLDQEGALADIAPLAARALEAHSWPGNVRELEHQMRRVAALGVARVELDHLSRDIRAAMRSASRAPARPQRAPKPESERREVEAALAACDGNITRAAERLRLTRHGLKKRMVRLGLRAPNGRVA